MARPIFSASAFSAPARIPPAELAPLLVEATTAAASPAITLISPPAAADTAPCSPARPAAPAAMAAVAASCHFKTVRIGLPRRRSMTFSPRPAKRKNYNRCTPRLAQLLQQLIEVLQARIVHHHLAGALAPGADLHRGAESLGNLLLEPR